MEIDYIHELNVGIEKFKAIQNYFSNKISLQNLQIAKGIKFCAGVDIAYWCEGETELGVCCIVVINYETKGIIETVYSSGKITVPYLPGYLAFRELPLVVQAAKKLYNVPDLFMFDGNGYLHPRHMGIASHASLFLRKPTIGIAKNYFKINNATFKMPLNQPGAYADITVDKKAYGRILRTHKDMKPIFISCGNDINLETTTEITLHLVTDKIRLPLPVQLADSESRQMRKLLTN